MLLFDRIKMLQVFYNIGKNAVDAMEGQEQKRLVVRMKENGGSVVLDFTDNGTGITAEHLDRIFDPFFTTKEAGTGFGLPICYKIVESHGGTIEVASQAGIYTRVRLILPKSEADETKVS